MSLLIDTDDEMNRYDEAALYAKTVKPDLAPGIRSSFNVGTGQTDLLAPLPSGGFVKLGSQAPEITVEAPEIMMEAPAMPGMGADAALPVEDDEFQLQSIRNYAASGANISSRDDYLAAGYTDQQIDASGVMGETQQKTGRTDPLSTTEIESILSEGGSVFQNYDPTMRENGAAALTETLIELRVNERREELLEQYAKPDASEAETEALNVEISRIIASEQPEMRSLSENLADAVFGNKNVLGTGVGDFVTAGVMDMQEGWRMYTDALRNDSPANRALGVLLMAAGVAEATGVGMVLGKTIKKSIPMMQRAMVSMGQNAELRMAERGPAVDFLSSTMMSGVDPTIATDPLVAAAGRAVGGDLSKQVDDARIAYEASPNDAALRKNYLELRRQRDADPVAQVELPTATKPGIIAFHGSGADFNKFNIEEIGTGEGNQAFGYGLYFTDSKDIAKFYRDSVGMGNKVKYKGKTVQDLDNDFASKEENIAHMVGQQNNKKDQVRVIENEIAMTQRNLSGIQQSIKDNKFNPKVYPLKFHGMELELEKAVEIEADFQDRLNAAVEVQKNISSIETQPSGKLYKVGIEPTENELLNYDVGFQDQTPFIQTAIEKVLDQINVDDAINLGIDVFSPPYSGNEQAALQAAKDQMLRDFSVVRFLNDWSVLRGAENSGEQLLEGAGVKGITYKANQGVGARNAPETGTRNYVIFDDSMIKILEKYGIVGPVAISAMALSEDET